jgi:hypothetical protein
MYPVKYDKDCSIIKQPVTSDEFRKEIDLLKEEIANLKKAKHNFIIDLVDFDKEDKEIEEKNKELLLYLKSLIETEDFKDNGIIKIKYESNVIMYEKIRDLIKKIERKRNNYNHKIYEYSDLLNYLKKRNLSLMFPAEPNGLDLIVEDNLDFAIIKSHRVNRNHINQVGYNGRCYFIL